MPVPRVAVVVLVLLTPACRLASPRSETLVGSYRGETETDDVDLELRQDGTAWYLELPKDAEFYGGFPCATWSSEWDAMGVWCVRFWPGASDSRSPVTFAVEAEGGWTTLVRTDGTRLRRVQ